jgi:hypothetical protein
MSVTIAEDGLDISELGRLVPTIGAVDFAESAGASGPLRLGGRGKDDFRLTATVQLHRIEQYPHWHLSIRATASKDGVVVPREVPTLSEFFGAVVTGLSQPDSVAIFIDGDHIYPRAWWKRGTIELPVPYSREGQPEAELTGVEVSYKAEIEPERVSVSVRGDTFVVLTSFLLPEPIGPDLFAVAVRRSAAIAGRLFDQPTETGADDA